MSNRWGRGVPRASGRVLFVLGLLSAGTAGAAPSAADRATARNLAQDGESALQRNDYKAAADLFTRADSLVHAPTLLYWLAKSQIALGKLVEAHENLQRIVREGVPPGSPKSWSKALDDATRDVEVIAARLPWVTFRIEGSNNAAATLDDAPLPPAAIGVMRAINPGTHIFRASAPGLTSAEQTFSIAEGQTQDCVLRLGPLPRAAATAAEPSRMAPDALSSRSTPLRKPLAYGLVGLGGVGIIVGTVTGVMAISKHATLADECQGGFVCGPGQNEVLKSYRRLGAISTAAFIAGGAAATGGIVLLLTMPKGEPARAAQMTPFVGVGGAGVSGVF
jgi:hypothetical protein